MHHRSKKEKQANAVSPSIRRGRQLNVQRATCCRTRTRTRTQTRSRTRARTRCGVSLQSQRAHSGTLGLWALVSRVPRPVSRVRRCLCLASCSERQRHTSCTRDHPHRGFPVTVILCLWTRTTRTATRGRGGLCWLSGLWRTRKNEREAMGNAEEVHEDKDADGFTGRRLEGMSGASASKSHTKTKNPRSSIST